MSGQKRYALLLDEDDIGPAKVVEKKKEKRHKSSSSRREKPRERSRERSPRKSDHTKSIRKRDNEVDDRWGDQSEEEEEEPEFQESAPKRVKIDKEDSEEEERRKDQEEKDAFTRRLQEKDSRKLDRSSTKEETIMAQRKALADNPAANMTEIRLRSRQDYLKKREAERLALLRKQVEEESEELRSGIRLSKSEVAEFAKNREVLRIAEERLRIDDHLDGYLIPDGQKSKEESLYKRQAPERDMYGKEVHLSEIELWEKEQLQKQAGQVKSTERVDDGQYDYLLNPEQGIRFLSDAIMPGEGKVLTKEERFLLNSLDAAEKKALSMKEARESLPIFAYRQAFLDAIREYQVLIVVGETGSGKTTQLTQFLYENGYAKNGMIGCTQPRRVAAMSVAKRVSEEMSVKLGQEVGYTIRFEDCTSPDKTIIKYMTDGMCLREFMTDPSLSSYSALMIDEAHERGCNSDILLALVKDLAKARPELKIIISSATMDAAKFSEYFANTPIFSTFPLHSSLSNCPLFNINTNSFLYLDVPGRRFPVDIHYTSQPEANYLSAAITSIFQIHTSQPKGDILVFLTGQEEIEAAEQHITEISRKLGNRVGEVIICPIFANLDTERQAKIFEPTPEGARKVVLATNIAETSLTIDGIVYVIDSGFTKELVYTPATGMSSLQSVAISRASALQRSGRAGRVSPGKCFRLYTKWAYMNEMDESTTPEIQRSNLNSVVLLLTSMGIHDLLNFDFLDPPPTETLISSLNVLFALGALNHRGELTKIGRQVSVF
jgi:pre-mRNA-splicing factor ATP-dependent RNA helicase DHX16